jgi:hypothetical protein
MRRFVMCVSKAYTQHLSHVHVVMLNLRRVMLVLKALVDLQELPVHQVRTP